MRRIILAATMFLLVQDVLPGLENEFQTDYWFADGVAIGRVVAMGDQTVDFRIREWVRDRAGQRKASIRGYRYRPWGEDVIGSAKPAEYTVDQDYLLLMR